MQFEFVLALGLIFLSAANDQLEAALVTFRNITQTSVIIEWPMPPLPSDQYGAYRLTYRPTSVLREYTYTIDDTVPTSATSTPIVGLLPGTEYEVGVGIFQKRTLQNDKYEARGTFRTLDEPNKVCDGFAVSPEPIVLRTAPPSTIDLGTDGWVELRCSAQVKPTGSHKIIATDDPWLSKKVAWTSYEILWEISSFNESSSSSPSNNDTSIFTSNHSAVQESVSSDSHMNLTSTFNVTLAMLLLPSSVVRCLVQDWRLKYYSRPFYYYSPPSPVPGAPPPPAAPPEAEERRREDPTASEIHTRYFSPSQAADLECLTASDASHRECVYEWSLNGRRLPDQTSRLSAGEAGVYDCHSNSSLSFITYRVLPSGCVNPVSGLDYPLLRFDFNQSLATFSTCWDPPTHQGNQSQGEELRYHVTMVPYDGRHDGIIVFEGNITQATDSRRWCYEAVLRNLSQVLDTYSLQQPFHSIFNASLLYKPLDVRVWAELVLSDNTTLPGQPTRIPQTTILSWLDLSPLTTKSCSLPNNSVTVEVDHQQLLKLYQSKDLFGRRAFDLEILEVRDVPTTEPTTYANLRALDNNIESCCPGFTQLWRRIVKAGEVSLELRKTLPDTGRLRASADRPGSALVAVLTQLYPYGRQVILPRDYLYCDLPEPPSNLTVVSRSDTNVTLSWSDGGGGGGGSSTTFEVNTTAGGGMAEPHPPTSLTNITIDNLCPSSEYTFEVVATNDDGRGSPSTPLTVHTAPLPPVRLTARSSSMSSVTVQWEGSTAECGEGKGDPPSPPMHYIVRWYAAEQEAADSDSHRLGMPPSAGSLGNLTVNASAAAVNASAGGILTAEIPNLAASTGYRVGVSAVSQGVEGRGRHVAVRTLEPSLEWLGYAALGTLAMVLVCVLVWVTVRCGCWARQRRKMNSRLKQCFTLTNHQQYWQSKPAEDVTTLYEFAIATESLLTSPSLPEEVGGVPEPHPSGESADEGESHGHYVTIPPAPPPGCHVTSQSASSGYIADPMVVVNASQGCATTVLYCVTAPRESGSPYIPDPLTTEGGSPYIPDPLTTEGGSPYIPDPLTTEGGSPYIPDPLTTEGGSPYIPDPLTTEGDSPFIPAPLRTEGDSPYIPDPLITEGGFPLFAPPPINSCGMNTNGYIPSPPLVGKSPHDVTSSHSASLATQAPPPGYISSPFPSRSETDSDGHSFTCSHHSPTECSLCDHHGYIPPSRTFTTETTV